MWNKILVLIVVFFIVANPATFKIVRGLLGGWVASADGKATPAGLILHAAVFVGLAIFLPKALMGASGFATPRQKADAAARKANRERTKALKLEQLVARELYEEEPEEYEEDDSEGYAMMSQAARQAAEERRAAKYKARADAAAAKLTAAGVPLPK